MKRGPEGRGRGGEGCTENEQAITNGFELWVLYLEEFLDYEGCLDGGDAAGRDEDDMRMSFTPAVCCSETLCHVVSRQAGVSVMALVLVVHTVVTKCQDISGPRQPLLFYSLFYFIYFPGRSLVTAKLNLNLKFVSAKSGVKPRVG